jgi:signal transduction histidine kinase
MRHAAARLASLVGRIGLAGRLLVALGLVVAVGAVTFGLVAAVAGPPIFRTHLGHVSGVPPEVSGHVEQAYASAYATSLGVALPAALAVAAVVSLLIARRLARPVAALATVAGQVADGQYQARAASPRLGTEFDRLATAFNQMAARLAAIEEVRRRMLADLAHEMRTPVATIVAYLDAAADGVAVPGEDPDQVLRSQAERLRRLAEDLGSISRAEELPLDRRPVCPAALVSAAADGARRAYAGKGVVLHARCDAGLPEVSVDPDRIAQVLANLLDNALRHTAPGGEVRLTACAAARAVTLAVHDTGEGIAADQLPHVFERFYRGDAARRRDRGGSGIGLTIARAVVTAHDGALAAASPGPGGGASFTVTLPRRGAPGTRGRGRRDRAPAG